MNASSGSGEWPILIRVASSMMCASASGVKTNVSQLGLFLRYTEMPPPCGCTMVKPEQLSVARGQLGPKCAGCDEPLIFGESLVIDDRYYCLDCYERISGVSSSSDPKEVDGLRMD